MTDPTPLLPSSPWYRSQLLRLGTTIAISGLLLVSGVIGSAARAWGAVDAESARQIAGQLQNIISHPGPNATSTYEGAELFMMGATPANATYASQAATGQCATGALEVFAGFLSIGQTDVTLVDDFLTLDDVLGSSDPVEAISDLVGEVTGTSESAALNEAAGAWADHTIGDEMRTYVTECGEQGPAIANSDFALYAGPGHRLLASLAAPAHTHPTTSTLPPSHTRSQILGAEEATRIMAEVKAARLQSCSRIVTSQPVDPDTTARASCSPNGLKVEILARGSTFSQWARASGAGCGNFVTGSNWVISGGGVDELAGRIAEVTGGRIVNNGACAP